MTASGSGGVVALAELDDKLGEVESAPTKPSKNLNRVEKAHLARGQSIHVSYETIERTPSGNGCLDSGWLKKLPITHEEACACVYAGRLLVVSHRWEDKAAPDRKGVQLEAIRAFLRDDTSGQKFEWVWHELMSRRLRHTPGQAGPEA